MRLKRLINILSLLLLIALPISSFAAPNSGFLDDYSGLKADPDRSGAMIYRKSGVSPGVYNKIVNSTIEIWYHPNTKYKGISPDEMKVLADTFASVLWKSVGMKET